MNLLILADDLTGALDTGVQFAVRGISTKVVVLSASALQIPSDAEVVAIDTETRHVRPQTAAAIVANIIRSLSKYNIKTIYKKTDSALRGNVGAELNAVMTASHSRYLHFLPAFPQMNRIVQEGCLYINGIPVADSVFGRDPFEPVRHSEIKQIIGPYTEQMTTAETFDPNIPGGIVIYNSHTLQDMINVGLELKRKNELHTLAGCAGFASLLPDLLELRTKTVSNPACGSSLLVICGSVNPISTEQIACAASGPFITRHLGPEQITPNWFLQRDGTDFLQELHRICNVYPLCALDTGGISGNDAKNRLTISRSLGYTAKWLLDQGIPHTILLTGGEHVLAFIQQLQVSELTPICELISGVVLFSVRYQGKTHYLLSKSGGFGAPELLLQLAELLYPPSLPSIKKGVHL